MNKIIFLVAIFFASPGLAVLTSSDKFLYDVSGNEKKILLCGDVHFLDYPDMDKKQLQDLKQILISRGQHDQNIVNVYIEKPPACSEYNTVLTDVCDYLKDLPFTLTKNSEIRCASHVANFLFHERTRPEWVDQDMCFDTAKKKVTVTDVTFGSLVKEYEDEKRKVDSFFNTLPSDGKLAKVLTQEQECLENSYDYMSQVIRNLNIADEDSCYEVAFRLHKTENKSKLLHAISKTFDNLFEVHLLRKLLKNHPDNCKNFVVIAGLAHVCKMNPFLQRIGAKLDSGYATRYDLVLKTVTPLPYKKMDLFAPIPTWSEYARSWFSWQAWRAWR